MTDKLRITIRCHWYRVSTKWLFWLHKNLHYFAHKFCLQTFAHGKQWVLRVFVKFCCTICAKLKVLHKTILFKQIVENCYFNQRINNWRFIHYYMKKWIRLYYSRLITFSTSLMTIVGRNRQQFWYFTLFLNC